MTASGAGSFPVPLTAHVGGATNVWSVSKVVPTQVSSEQTVSHDPPGTPSHPPSGLASAMQVEAISRMVMVQMSGIFEAFQAPNLRVKDVGE